MASDPRNPLLGLDTPPATLQDSLQSLVGGGVPVQRNSAELDRYYERSPRFRIRNLLRRVRGEPQAQSMGLLGLAYPESKRLFGLLPSQEERIIVRDEGEQPERVDRETLMHEFGHVADFRKKYPEAYEAVQAVRPEGRNPAEHYADAFMSAISLLQDEASHNPRVVERLVPLMDQDVPGTRTMLETLLRDPLYRKHPLARRGLL